MAWETTKSGARRYAVKVRIYNKVMSRFFKTEEEANLFRAQIAAEKAPIREAFQSVRAFDRWIKNLKLLEKEIYDQQMILKGLIKRKGTYVKIKNLRKPLTTAETDRIRRVKARPLASQLGDLGI